VVLFFTAEAISFPPRHCEEALLFHADEAIAFTVLGEVLISTLLSSKIIKAIATLPSVARND